MNAPTPIRPRPARGIPGAPGEVTFGARRIAYGLFRKRRRGLRRVIFPDGEVRVNAPLRATDAEVRRFVESRAAWVARHLERLARLPPPPPPRRYVSGETFLLLGREYPLKLVADPAARRPRAALEGDCLVAAVRDPGDAAQVRRAVQEWYARQATEVFPRCVNACLPVAAQHGLPAPAFKLRQMRSRWGSCSRTGRVTLSTHLIKTPLPAIEYVIMHELCHLVHHNHGPAFYRLLTECMPDWRARKGLLGTLNAE